MERYHILFLFMTALLCYSVWRFVVPFYANGRYSYKNYWSRIVFRALYVLYIIGTQTIILLYIINPLIKVSVVISESLQALFILSTLFLMKSSQDFANFSNRTESCLSTNWKFLGTIFSMFCLLFPVLNSVFRNQGRTDLISIVTIVVYSVTLIVLLVFIYIPVFIFIYEVHQIDLGIISSKLQYAAVFFTFVVIVLIACIGLNIIKEFKMLSDIIKIIGIWLWPLFITLCGLTQDIIDWMLEWISTEDTSEYRDVCSTNLFE